MNKYALSILFAVMLLFGCNKEPINTEEDITNVLDGWQIFKTKYDFENPRDLYFVNESVGFVVGYNGKIYKTTNGGAIWRELDSGTRSHLHSVYFINEKEGFVSSGRNSHGSELLKTNDGGETWTKTSFPEYIIIWSMKFFDAMNGIALVEVPTTITDSRSYVAITSDGGESWNLIDLAIYPVGKLFFVDNLVYVAGTNQRIFKSSDYGHSWETINTPIEAYNYVRNIFFYNENIGYIDGITNVYKTLDGGLSWNRAEIPFTKFDTFHFSSEDEVFNIETVSEYEEGDFPTIKGSICYKTNDGGKTWKQSKLLKSLYLGKTYFPKRDVGFGYNGSEFYTIKKIE